MNEEFNLARHLESDRQRRIDDAERYKVLDDELCMICHTRGEDKRSWRLSCGYAVHEVIPEALNVTTGQSWGYYLNLCKSCRGAFLGALKTAADERRALRGMPMSHDGCPEILELDRNIPVRVNGAVVMMTQEEYKAYKVER